MLPTPAYSDVLPHPLPNLPVSCMARMESESQRLVGRWLRLCARAARLFRRIKKFRELLGFSKQQGRPEVIAMKPWLATETALVLGSRCHLAQCHDQNTGNCSNQNPCRKSNPKHVALLVSLNMKGLKHHTAGSSTNIICRCSPKSQGFNLSIFLQARQTDVPGWLTFSRILASPSGL